MRGVPFARAKAMMAQVAVAMALAGMAQQTALSAIGPYESRGHGKGQRQASRNTAAQVKRASIKAKNRTRNRGAHRG